MKRTILIPTDFSIGSLKLFIKAAQAHEHQSVDIIFLHGVYLPDSIIDLLFYSPDSLNNSLMTQDFKDACNIIRNKYASSIQSIRVEIFSGSTQRAFENFLEANKIDEAFIAGNYKPFKPNKNSFDVTSFVRQSAVPMTEVSWPEPANVPEQNTLAALFQL